jgi:RNA polymerase sigma-70 factor, ECF subfamily
VKSSSPLTKQWPTDGPSQPSSGVCAVPGAEAHDLRGIFDTYAPFVWRTLRHLGIADSDVDDVCQDVFVAIHRKLAGFEGRSSLRTWIYGICLRVTSDHRRLAHVRRELPVAEVSQDAMPPTQFDDYARSEARHLLASLLDVLDQDKRAVFVLYEIEELSMKEVAEAVGCPLQTAYSRLHAARKLVLEAAGRARLKEQP